MATIRVIAAVVDTTKLTLYKEDGKTVTVLQGDDRLKDILDEIKTPIIEGRIPVEVDLREPEVVKDTTFADYEKKSGGLTRFFRVLKEKVVHLLDRNHGEAESVQPQTLGSVPGSSVTHDFRQESKANPKVLDAVDEIMANAEPVSADGYEADDTTNEHTIVAVIETSAGPSVIPDAQKLKGHLGHAVSTGNTKGMEAFMARLGTAIHKRGHSVDDVLQFMEKGDLPVADDGTIIAYKVLKTISGKGSDLFFDCHTGRVPQRIGSFVCMDESLVDPSRHRDCSNGLHIARRGYLGGFRGDIIVMCKIAPEDIIAVPHRDANKVRVCGYHILARIPRDEHANLRSNKAIQGTNAQKLLTMAIAGEHIGRIEEVRITEQAGGGVIITPLVEGKVIAPQPTKETAKTAPIPEPIKPGEPKPLDAAPVDVKAVAEEVKQTKAPEKREAKMARLYQELQISNDLATKQKIARELLDMKKYAKKSWTALTLPETVGIVINDLLGISEKPGKMSKAAQAKQEEAVSAMTSIVEAVPEEEEPVSSNERTIPKMEGNRVEKARQLFDKAAAGDKASWGHLWLHKKQAKQGWDKLGFTKKEEERIKLNKPEWV